MKYNLKLQIGMRKYKEDCGREGHVEEVSLGELVLYITKKVG